MIHKLMSFAICSYLLNNFHPKKPIVNHSVLLQKLKDALQLPVTKSALVETEAIVKLEQYKNKYYKELGNLEKPLDALIENWKTIQREQLSSKILPTFALDALRRKYPSSYNHLSSIYESLYKQTLVLQEGKDIVYAHKIMLK